MNFNISLNYTTFKPCQEGIKMEWNISSCIIYFSYRHLREKKNFSLNINLILQEKSLWIFRKFSLSSSVCFPGYSQMVSWRWMRVPCMYVTWQAVRGTVCHGITGHVIQLIYTGCKLHDMFQTAISVFKQLNFVYIRMLSIRLYYDI